MWSPGCLGTATDLSSAVHALHVGREPQSCAWRSETWESGLSFYLFLWPRWILRVAVHWGGLWHLEDVLLICLNPEEVVVIVTLQQMYLDIMGDCVDIVEAWWTIRLLLLLFGRKWECSNRFNQIKDSGSIFCFINLRTKHHDSIRLALACPSCCWSWGHCQSCACSPGTELLNLGAFKKQSWSII